jgi:hypothetical protein
MNGENGMRFISLFLFAFVLSFSAPALAKIEPCKGYPLDHVIVQSGKYNVNADIEVIPPDVGDGSSHQEWNYLNTNPKGEGPVVTVGCFFAANNRDGMEVTIPHKYKKCVFNKNKFFCE